MGKSDLDCCGKTLKYSLFIVNFFIFVFGLTICGLSIWALVSEAANVEQLLGTNFYVPAAGMFIAFGGLVAFISFLGCCGAIKEVKCLLGTFFVIMLILAILIAVAAILGFVLKAKIGDEMRNLIKNSMNEYGDDATKKPFKDAWDQVQTFFECCGTDGYIDWKGIIKPPEYFPKTCCKSGNSDCNIVDPPKNGSYYNQGCMSSIDALMLQHTRTFAYLGIATAAVIVLSMIFSCSLCLMI